MSNFTYFLNKLILGLKTKQKAIKNKLILGLKTKQKAFSIRQQGENCLMQW